MDGFLAPRPTPLAGIQDGSRVPRHRLALRAALTGARGGCSRRAAPLPQRSEQGQESRERVRREPRLREHASRCITCRRRWILHAPRKSRASRAASEHKANKVRLTAEASAECSRGRHLHAVERLHQFLRAPMPAVVLSVRGSAGVRFPQHRAGYSAIAEGPF